MSNAIVNRFVGQRVFIGDAEVRISRVKNGLVSLAISTVNSEIHRPSKEDDKKDKEAARMAWVNGTTN